MSLVQYFVDKSVPENKFLNDAFLMINWGELDELLNKYIKHKSGGRPPYPLILLLKMHLLQMWYGLSDEQTEFQCNDRLTFRKFLNLAIEDKIPDATTLENFRHVLTESKIADFLVEYLNKCCVENGLIKKEGTLVDATFIKANSRPHTDKNKNSDIDAEWGHKGFGYKTTVNVDKDSKLIRAISTAPNNVSEAREFREILLGDEAEVFADKGYDRNMVRDELKAKKIKQRIMYQTRRSKSGEHSTPHTEQKEAFNQSSSKIRARVEHVFAFWKYVFRCTRARYRGLERVAGQMMSLTLAYNLRRMVFLIKQKPSLAWGSSA